MSKFLRFISPRVATPGWKFFIFTLFLLALPSQMQATVKVGISTDSYQSEKEIRAIFEGVEELELVKIGASPELKSELFIYHDFGNPIEAFRNVVGLVELDEVDLLFGLEGARKVNSILPLLLTYSTREGKTPPLFFPISGAQAHRLNPYKDSVFNLLPSDIRQAEALKPFAEKMEWKRLLPVLAQGPDGRSVFAALQKTFTEEGVVQGEILFNSSSPEWERILPLMRKFLPDALIISGRPEDLKSLISYIRGLGWEIPLVVIGVRDVDVLAQYLHKLGQEEGLNFERSIYFFHGLPPLNQTNLPAVKEYLDLLSKKDYNKASMVGFETYLGVKALRQVIFRARQEELKLKDAAESLTDLDLGLGEKFSYSVDDHEGLKRVYLSRPKDGSLQLVKD